MQPSLSVAMRHCGHEKSHFFIECITKINKGVAILQELLFFLYKFSSCGRSRHSFRTIFFFLTYILLQQILENLYWFWLLLFIAVFMFDGKFLVKYILFCF